MQSVVRISVVLAFVGVLAGCGQGTAPAVMGPVMGPQAGILAKDTSRNLETVKQSIIEALTRNGNVDELELTVTPTANPNVFDFKGRADLRVRSSTPGFAGGYLYRTETKTFTGSFDNKAKKVLNLKTR